MSLGEGLHRSLSPYIYTLKQHATQVLRDILNFTVCNFEYKILSDAVHWWKCCMYVTDKEHTAPPILPVVGCKWQCFDSSRVSTLHTSRFVHKLLHASWYRTRLLHNTTNLWSAMMWSNPAAVHRIASPMLTQRGSWQLSGNGEISRCAVHTHTYI